MTKKDYDDLDDLFNDLENDLIDIMTDEVDKVVKKVYENQVDYMYEEYDRTYYEPRYKNDGFADKDNMEQYSSLNLIQYSEGFASFITKLPKPV